MWHLEHIPTQMLPDVARFLAALQSRASFFRPDAPLLVGRAPGRLDLMGGIADYSGALVLELPLGAAAFVAAQHDDQPRLRVATTVAEAALADELELPLDALLPPGGLPDYARARALLAADPARHWAAYLLGVLLVLVVERGLRLSGGLRLLVASEVPAGKGISSSAAVEVATLQALAGLYDLDIPGREAALLCQKAENLVVGAPCGVMDQMTAACGEEGRLLALLCQPAELQGSIPLPPEVEVWGVDSGIRHAVTGADYGSVRVGAFMGYRIVAAQAGLTVRRDSVPGLVQIDDPRWGGYLANIAPSLWETAYRAGVPERISGQEFLDRFAGFSDQVTTIDPDRTYAVRQPTAHPIYEHQRVQLFRALLQSEPLNEERLGLLGELMFQSHASYSACGLGSAGTDQLVELVRAAGPESGLYGAKITGGGSGGTVAVLARRGSGPAIEALADRYARASGRVATIVGGSSPGAASFGTLRLLPAGVAGAGQA